MSLTRQQKEEAVQLVEQDITGATAVVFMSYNGLALADVNELRNKLYEAGCSMRVVPKRLLRIATQQANLEFDPTVHDGQIAVIWGSDAVAPAKVLAEFAKGRETVQLRAGVLEGSDISFEQVQALANLPTREQLLGQLVGTLAAPVTGLARVLSGVQRQTVYVLQAIADQKQQNA
ncbi:MAG: 50S ribosomal protein L10 [Candidatus Andersenbacteria bacterium]